MLTRFNSAWMPGRRIRTVETDTCWGGGAACRLVRWGWGQGRTRAVAIAQLGQPFDLALGRVHLHLGAKDVLALHVGAGWGMGGGKGGGKLAARWPKDSRQCLGTRSVCPGRGARHHAAGQQRRELFHRFIGFDSMDSRAQGVPMQCANAKNEQGR